MTPRPASRRSAFTLVEVMFALVITGVLMAALYQIFFATTSQAHRIDAKYEAMRSALVAAEVISREVDRLVTLPTEKDDAGRPEPRYGDHTRPAYVGPDGRGVSFYVPDPSPPRAGEPETAEPLMIHLAAAETGGVFLLRRDQGAAAVEAALAESERRTASDTDEAVEAVTDGPVPGSRIYKGVHLRSLRFRLLSPMAAREGARSPDDNYYLEAVVVGTDRRGREQNALTVLKPLLFPSRRLADPQVPAVEYRPEAPLSPPGVVVNPSPEEAAAADELVRIADAWTKGELTPEELVEAARDALTPVSGQVPTGGLVSSTPEITPLGPGARVLTPLGSPVTAVGAPGGPVLVLPPGPNSDPAPVSSVTPQGEEVWFTGWGKTLDGDGNVIFETGFEGGGTVGPDGAGWDEITDSMETQMEGVENAVTGVARDWIANQRPGGSRGP